MDQDGSWPHNELCQWRIQATHGEKIVLNVTMLDLPDSVDCATSYLEVRDGASIKAPLIGQWTFPVQHRRLFFIIHPSRLCVSFFASVSINIAVISLYFLILFAALLYVQLIHILSGSNQSEDISVYLNKTELYLDVTPWSNTMYSKYMKQ